jgi:hypothetical protein
MKSQTYKFKIPCWVTTSFDFDLVVEASSEINALLELKRLLKSSDPKDISYIETQIPKECPAGDVDFHDDDGIVELIDEDRQENVQT